MTTNPEPIERLYTLDEIREVGKASRATVYRWRKERGLRVVRVGGIVRVKESDWLRFLERHTEANCECDLTEPTAPATETPAMCGHRNGEGGVTDESQALPTCGGSAH